MFFIFLLHRLWPSLTSQKVSTLCAEWGREATDLESEIFNLKFQDRYIYVFISYICLWYVEKEHITHSLGNHQSICELVYATSKHLMSQCYHTPAPKESTWHDAISMLLGTVILYPGN